ncbi:dTMP kinase [Patescibacteria group bacterium]|nr:dTMP kinase [Patescibacteria group bacterium]MBU4512861.1 dTMP kinase [Patescibacteria group bacterium]MCG2693636.1 dTMP kinase [Candidatus Parcubacteria bacterium]
MPKGKFIIFEGPDGSGQTTQASLLADSLTKAGKNIFLTKEPADELDKGIIRSILRSKNKVSLETLELYFTANRGHHLDAQIKPALDRGKWVVCDRYFFSTLAFGMLEIDYRWLWEINSKFVVPDLTFFLDVPADVCMDRLQRRGGERELFEQEQKLDQVIKNYKEVFGKNQFPNVFIIDGDRDIGIIAKEIWGIVSARLK